MSEQNVVGGAQSPERHPDHLTRVPWVAVAVFVAVAYGLAWLITLPLWLMGPDAPAFAALFTPLAVAMMFTPGLATLAVVFSTRVPRGERMRFLGMWPLRPAKRVVWMTVAALFWPLMVVALSVVISASLGWVRLDLENFSGFQEVLDAQLATLGGSAAETAVASMPPIGLLVALQLLLVPFGALVNSIPAFGEEIGWRGWLLGALRPLGVWPALIVSGVIWGVWHSPVILLGYNFGLTDWRGVAFMIGGCIAWGVLLGWARLRSGSLWPAVMGHGALNASGGTIMLLVASDSPLDPVLVVPVGVAGWIAAAIVVVVLVLCGQFRRDRLSAALARPPRS